MEWKPIEGYDFPYLISEKGDVKKYGYILKQLDRHGHPHVQLKRNGKLYWRRVCVLVLSAFNSKGKILGSIWHEDLDRTNNHISNLKWVDRPTYYSLFYKLKFKKK